MKIKTSIRLTGITSKYPISGILVAIGLVLLSPFVSAYLSYIAFMICIYRIVRHDAKVFAADYATLVPVAQFMRTTGGMSFVIWLCLIAAIWHFIRGKVQVGGALLSLLLLLNYLLVRMQTNVNGFVLCFGQMFVLYVLLPKQDTESSVRVANCFCWSMLLTSIYALLLRNAPQIELIRGPESPAIWGTNIMRFSGLIKDPNYYMTLLLVGLAVMCKLKETGRIRSVRFWVSAVVFTAFGVLTYSKTFFLVFILLGGLYIIWQFWSKKVFKGIFFASMAVLAGLFLLLSEHSPFAVVIERFTSSDSLSDITTGRTDLFKTYWNVISENAFNFMFGKGLDAPVIEKGTHNLFLEIVYHTGFAGFTMIAFFYGSIISSIHKRTDRVNKQSIIAKYIVVFIMFVQYMALQGMFQLITYAGLFVAILSVNITEKVCDDN